jgi:hypothetical protein
MKQETERTLLTTLTRDEARRLAALLDKIGRRRA